MKYIDDNGNIAYLNIVNKGHGDRWIVQAVSGQTLKGRDGERLKSRSFKTEYHAYNFLERNGYKSFSYS